MRHCWTDRYEASGNDDRTDVELQEMNRRWNPEETPLDAWETVSQYLGETCMLRAGHKGPHRFQPIDTITIQFGSSVEVVL